MIDQFMNMMQIYKQQMDDDFNAEWSKQRFKWFMKKRRQEKMRNKIFRRYKMGIYSITEDYIQGEVNKAIEESLDGFVTVKDLSLGDKNYFTEENAK